MHSLASSVVATQAQISTELDGEVVILTRLTENTTRLTVQAQICGSTSTTLKTTGSKFRLSATRFKNVTTLRQSAVRRMFSPFCKT